MNNSPPLSIPLPMLISALVLALLLGWTGQPVHAGELGAPFTVRVVLNGESNGICRSTNQMGVFGAAVTIDCTTGSPSRFSGDTRQLPWSSAQDGPFRYLTLRSAAGELLGSVESHSSRGITNSWNVVKVNDREYIEFTVSW